MLKSGDDDLAVYRSRMGKAGDPAVLQASGAGATLTGGSFGRDHSALTGRGFTVAHGLWGATNHWGRDAAQTLMASGKTAIQAAPWGARSGKVGLIGYSMGGLLALLFALNNPTLVFAVAVGIPALSPIDIHDNDRGGYASDIESAYGGLSAWNSAKATHDPASLAASYWTLDVPIKVWYSNNDPITPTSVQVPFVIQSGTTGVNMGDQTTGPSGYEGHAVHPAFYQEAADWLASHA